MVNPDRSALLTGCSFSPRLAPYEIEDVTVHERLGAEPCPSDRFVAHEQVHCKSARHGRGALPCNARGEAAAQTSMARTMANAADASAEVVLRALSLLGVPYRYGGNTPNTGLDCSGLVKLVFQETVGLALPRRSDDMSRFGQSVGWTDLQPGDLVFFNTMRFSFSHVGIYIGEGQFVHAPSSGSVVRVEALNKDYWVKRFDGARRLVASPPAALASVVR